MVVRPAVFVLLGALIVAAAGAGSWLAVRQSSVDMAAVIPTATAGTEPGSLQRPIAEAAFPAEAPVTPAPLPEAAPPAASEPPPPAAEAAPPPPMPPPAAEARAAEAPVTPAPASAASAERPAPAAEAIAAPEERAEAATAPPPAAAPTTPLAAAAATADPALPAAADPGAEHAAADAGAPADPEELDEAVRTASAELSRVDGWVRSPDPGTLVYPDPPPTDYLTINADSVIGLQFETAVSSADAEVEDNVIARVTRDVLVGGRVAIPAGTLVRGSVVLVEQAGKLRGTPRLGVRFHEAVMEDDTELDISTETIYRDGPAKGSESTRRIGGAAVGGAILGAIFGGRQGAAIGSAAGAASGTAMALAQDGPPATFPAGTRVTIRLLNSAEVQVDRLHPGSR